MKLNKVLLLGLILGLLLYPNAANAEIATTRDWIGFFPINAAGTKANTVLLASPTPADFPDGHAWAYTSTCTQLTPAPGAIPKLSDVTGCTFIVPSSLTGYYILRLYANDKDENTPEALIATSTQLSLYASPTPAPVRPAGKLYRITGDLTINRDITVNETGVVFVEGNLYINTEILNNNPIKGLVFVVKGSININRDVTQINSFLIAHGKDSGGADVTPFCTAWNTTTSTCEDYPDADNTTLRKYLTINGAIISLNTTVPPSFARKKYDPSTADKPAETLNYEPKYLVIMKDIFSRDLKIWREVQ